MCQYITKTFYEEWETLEPVTEIITVKGYELINIKIKLDQKDACKITAQFSSIVHLKV
jgi:hypothetical protein